MSPDDLKNTAWDDQAVESVERRFEVDSGTQSPHSEEHFEDEKTQEHEFGSVWKGFLIIVETIASFQLKQYL